MCAGLEWQGVQPKKNRPGVSPGRVGQGAQGAAVLQRAGRQACGAIITGRDRPCWQPGGDVSVPQGGWGVVTVSSL